MASNDPLGNPASELVRKLTPRLLALILIVLLVALALVIFVALSRGGSVNLRDMTFSAPNEQSETISRLEALNVECTSELDAQTQQVNTLGERPTKEDLDQCQARYSQAVPIDKLVQIIGPADSGEAMLSKIQELATKDEDYAQLKQNYFFKLFVLERRIPDYGNSISTHYDRENRREVYKLIQEILLELGFYQGGIDGAQPATMEAVIKFQDTYNAKLQSDANLVTTDVSIEELKPLGHVGYRTLEAFRSWYRENQS